jgi:hypothetical protein
MMKKAIGDKLCAAVGFSVVLGRCCSGVALDRFNKLQSWYRSYDQNSNWEPQCSTQALC